MKKINSFKVIEKRKDQYVLQEEENKKQEVKKQENKKQVKKDTIKNENNKKETVKKETPKKQNKKKQTKKTSSKNDKKIKNKKVINKEEKEIDKKKTMNIIKYGMLGFLFIIVILTTMFSPLFNIKKIEVQGNEKITEKEIISLSQLQIEENTFKINKNKIRKEIKQNAYINEVTISRKLPSSVIIKVEERKIAYLLEYAGSYVYLDKNGYILEINSEKLELPIIQGASTLTENFIVGKRLVTEDLEKLATVQKIMELARISEIDSLITRIDIENKENLKLIFESKEKVAYIGDNSNLNTKILTIKSILEKEEGKAGEIFVNIDLNKEYPVFRERV